MCIKSVFESINSIRHNDVVREAIPHVYDTITEKFVRSSYLHHFVSNLSLLPLVKYSPVTFFGKARATCGSYFPVKSLYVSIISPLLL